jgi:hypothetical protein
MSDFSATDVAFTGIRFVREHPRAVAVWAGIQVVISLVTMAIFLAYLGPVLAQLQSLGAPGSPRDPAAMLALTGRIWLMDALILPFSLVIYAVLHATMARAALTPSDEGFAYIRLGMDEVRQGLLILLWTAVCIGAEVAILILVLVPTLVVYLGFHGPHILVMALCIVLAAAEAVYCLVRLSLATPLTFDRRRVDLFGSWALTRGRFWKMLGTYLLVFGVALAILFLTMIITVAVAAVLGGVGALASMFQPSMMTMGTFFLPARLAVTVIPALATPLLWALVYMPACEIYRQLRPQGPGAEATFD